MQTKLLADDLDLLVSGVCPMCREPDRLIQHDAWNYECGCGWKFTIVGDELFGSENETTFDVFS
jgi:hypothetical protein